MTPIKADPTAQRRLLDLQAVDTAIRQLDHRRRTLPEHAVIAGLTAQLEAVESDLVAADTAVSDLELDQQRAENDLQPVRERLTRNQKRVADGTVTDSKALSSMVEEIEHLRRRISVLEDEELEVMQQLEDATTAQGRIAAQAAKLEADRAVAVAARDEKLGQLDGELADRRSVRATIVPDLPEDLIGLYAKLGVSHAGVGAAELRARRCTGCQLEVNAADLRTFAAAAADEVLRCEECGRILVRTPESGI